MIEIMVKYIEKIKWVGVYGLYLTNYLLKTHNCSSNMIESMHYPPPPS